MPSPENSELQDYIGQLLEATRSGLVRWRIANPTTFTWDSPGTARGRLILQRSERTEVSRNEQNKPITKKIPNYIFQVLELEGSNLVQRISINSSEDAMFNPVLEELYELIKSGFSRKALDFLKNVIPHPSR